MKTLQLVLKAVMLRRAKDTILNGRRLIELPPRIVHTVVCQFDLEELELYTALETRAVEKFTKLVDAETAGKKMFGIFVLLLRLRQGQRSHATSRPSHT